MSNLWKPQIFFLFFSIYLITSTANIPSQKISELPIYTCFFRHLKSNGCKMAAPQKSYCEENLNLFFHRQNFSEKSSGQKLVRNKQPFQAKLETTPEELNRKIEPFYIWYWNKVIQRKPRNGFSNTSISKKDFSALNIAERRNQSLKEGYRDLNRNVWVNMTK